MRYVMHLGVAVVLGLLALGTIRAVQQGSRMRESELHAALHTETLMRAQEAYRTRDPASRGDALYGSFAQLLDQGLIDDFEPVDADRTLLRQDGYLFRLVLLPSLNPADGVVRLGQRYDLWAWPEHLENRSMVIYYASNAGYLIQGENRELTGLNPMLPSVSPLRELDKLQERGITQTRRWTVLKNIRAS